MRVLILEDDKHLRHTFSAAFMQFEYDVTTSASIPEAEKALLKHRPDVAVLDLMIGKETSLPIAHLTAVLSPKTEIIFVTGSGMFPHAELFNLPAPVAAVLRKPVDIAHLIEVVSHIDRHPNPGLVPSDFQSGRRSA